MENEIIENQQENNQASDYIEAINKLKETTVSKEDYAKLQAEKKELLEALVNGERHSAEDAQPEKPDIKTLREQLFKPDHELNDIEYVTRTLALRKALLETGKDIFVGESHMHSPTQSDYEQAQNVADVLQDCLDSSNGNNAMFIARLQSRMNDVILPRR